MNTSQQMPKSNTDDPIEDAPSRFEFDATNVHFERLGGKPQPKQRSTAPLQNTAALD